jgi:hypothetical protein
MKLRINRNDILWCITLLLSACLIYVLTGLLFPFVIPHVPLLLLRCVLIMLSTLTFAAIGAGIGALFKRKVLGAIIGMILVGLFILLVALPAPHR